jgi:hypothetical protein
MPALPKMSRSLCRMLAAGLFAAGFALAPLAAPAAARSGTVGLRLPAPAAAKLHAGSHPVAPQAVHPAPRGFHPPAPYDPFYSYYAWFEPVGRGRPG